MDKMIKTCLEHSTISMLVNGSKRNSNPREAIDKVTQQRHSCF